ncbi:hypothetical protein [Endozoicomonas ascidiicola]|uniref:hypothetical protein n=1 Tax=Endozoicomonas ascidiicola TaxID=1698521 RepID=UPI000ADFEB5F|nr:hypothetical protein [Endozoicomonas ascidiicola]
MSPSNSVEWILYVMESKSLQFDYHTTGVSRVASQAVPSSSHSFGTSNPSKPVGNAFHSISGHSVRSATTPSPYMPKLDANQLGGRQVKTENRHITLPSSNVIAVGQHINKAADSHWCDAIDTDGHPFISYDEGIFGADSPTRPHSPDFASAWGYESPRSSSPQLSDGSSSGYGSSRRGSPASPIDNPTEFCPASIAEVQSGIASLLSGWNNQSVVQGSLMVHRPSAPVENSDSDSMGSSACRYASVTSAMSQESTDSYVSCTRRTTAREFFGSDNVKLLQQIKEMGFTNKDIDDGVHSIVRTNPFTVIHNKRELMAAVFQGLVEKYKTQASTVFYVLPSPLPAPSVVLGSQTAKLIEKAKEWGLSDDCIAIGLNYYFNARWESVPWTLQQLVDSAAQATAYKISHPDVGTIIGGNKDIISMLLDLRALEFPKECTLQVLTCFVKDNQKYPRHVAEIVDFMTRKIGVGERDPFEYAPWQLWQFWQLKF